MKKNIAILTSGGDASGMNTAIRAVTVAALNKGMKVFGVQGGYKGLYEGDFIELNKNIVEEYANRGGTFLGTKRFPEFKEPSIREVAVKKLQEKQIDQLVVIGGDGSYMGAKKLSELGIKCIALPGTIDNDISSSELTIGFDTSLNVIVDAVDKIKDTAGSHNRCMVVEVMGNECDDLAIYSGIALGADIIISKNHPVTLEQITEIMKPKFEAHQKSALIIVSEKIYNIKDVVEAANKAGWDSRGTVLGHIQRGGTPSAMERVNATRMSYFAVDLLEKGITGVCVGLKDGKLVYDDIYNALKKDTESNSELINLINNL